MIWFLAVLFIVIPTVLYFARHHLNTAQRIIMGVATLICAALFVWTAQKEYTKEEPTFDTRAVHWQKMPIRLGWNPAQFSGYESVIRNVITNINKQLGFTAIVSVGASEQSDADLHTMDATWCGVDVVTDMDLQESKTAPMWTYWCDNHTDTQVKYIDNIRVAQAQFHHELGHVLGLAHDPGGIMKPVLSEGNIPQFIEFSRKDVNAIRGRYLGGDGGADGGRQ